MYVPDSHLVQDDDDMDNSGKIGATNLGGEETTQPTLSAFAPHVSISTTKVNIIYNSENYFFISIKIVI